MSPVKIAVVGAAGRMGVEIGRAAASSKAVRIVAAVEHRDSPALGADYGSLCGLEAWGVEVGADLPAAAEAADVMIDVSLPRAFDAVVDAALEKRVALVCGTTGLEKRQLSRVDEAAEMIPVLYTTNLSLGVALLGELTARAARVLGTDYDVEIVEAHHRGKADAPSGTALTLAARAAEVRGLDPERAVVCGRRGHSEGRTNDEIGVHAVRGGSIFGEHTVLFAGANDRLELVHRASSRALFAQGALVAAAFMSGRPAGRYRMTDVLGGL